MPSQNIRSNTKKESKTGARLRTRNIPRCWNEQPGSEILSTGTVPNEEDHASPLSLKRTRSNRTDRSQIMNLTKNKKGRRVVGDIKSPTSRTLLRMLRVGTGEATANNVGKQEAEEHIFRLAGEFTPFEVLNKRYAGREALQVLLQKYLGCPITFQQATECFENPHNRGLQATQTLVKLLQGRPWPPYSENAFPRSDDGSSSSMEASRKDLRFEACNCPAVLVDEAKPGVKLPTRSDSLVASQNSFGRTVTTGAPGLGKLTAELNTLDPVETNTLVQFRPAITTGFPKKGTAFQAESDLESFARSLGVHNNSRLRLVSFHLLPRSSTGPAALATVAAPQARMFEEHALDELLRNKKENGNQI